MRRSTVTDMALCRAVAEMREGLVDAVLAGGLLKKRVASPGAREAGSVRTIVATRCGEDWFFLFGYEKNQRASISAAERDALQLDASEFMVMGPAQLDRAVKCGDLQEIGHDEGS